MYIYAFCFFCFGYCTGHNLWPKFNEPKCINRTQSIKILALPMLQPERFYLLINLNDESTFPLTISALMYVSTFMCPLFLWQFSGVFRCRSVGVQQGAITYVSSGRRSGVGWALKMAAFIRWAKSPEVQSSQARSACMRSRPYCS